VESGHRLVRITNITPGKSGNRQQYAPALPAADFGTIFLINKNNSLVYRELRLTGNAEDET